MEEMNKDKVIQILNSIMKFELAGVVRYTHYALMVTGPYRLPLEDFFKAQATESLLHAQEAGEILTSLGGHPSMDISLIDESNKHKIDDLLAESISHEKTALCQYKALLNEVEGKSIYIEEYARTQIKSEEQHMLSVQKLSLIHI